MNCQSGIRILRSVARRPPFTKNGWQILERDTGIDQPMESGNPMLVEASQEQAPPRLRLGFSADPEVRAGQPVSGPVTVRIKDAGQVEASYGCTNSEGSG